MTDLQQRQQHPVQLGCAVLQWLDGTGRQADDKPQTHRDETGDATQSTPNPSNNLDVTNAPCISDYAGRRDSLVHV